MVLKCLEKLRNWGIQESYKNDKLDTGPFKLIGLKGLKVTSQPKMYRSILVKIRNCCNPCLWGGSSPPLNVYAEGFASLSSKNKLCLYDFASLQNSFFGSMNRTWVSCFIFTSLSTQPLTPLRFSHPGYLQEAAPQLLAPSPAQVREELALAAPEGGQCPGCPELPAWQTY